METVASQRNLKNLPAVSFEKKTVNVTKYFYRQYILDKLIPTIKEKCATERTKAIRIQHYNSKPHIDVSDASFFTLGPLVHGVVRNRGRCGHW